MPLTLADLDFLVSSAGADLLDRLADEDLSDSQTLNLLTKLRRDYDRNRAGAALEMARLRLKAVDKFGSDAARLFFTREALEQASDPLVRQYRSRMAGGGHVLDVCCGIGSDSVALAQTGAQVLGLDIDPVRIAIARHNAAALGVHARFEVADAREGLSDAGDMIFYDPARRDANSSRIYDVERYQPPLALVRDWQAPLIAVKLSPGVNMAQLAPYGGAVEFISVGGDLKEAVLWLGDVEAGTRATLLVHGSAYHWSQAEQPASAPLSEPRGWLVEPDPALIRAGLVQGAAVRFNGAMLDQTIAYFTTGDKPDSSWVRAWRILDWIPFNLKRLRAYLRGGGVGRVTVKKRGSPLTPEELIPRLKLRGDESRTLVLTRCQGAPIVIICEDIVV